ncbi:uncharacterized protein [Branchiostoma lanceolatum]|uniref:uncharacterized protein n=1 Tax=Branchiostoma lanceolatum TaxID=7740 RepID=UPI0034557991
MSCDETHCDETKTKYNADVCEHCRSMEACFDQETTFCPSWNEAKCPDGLPAQNDSIPHKNVVQVGDNVKAVDPAETTLYTCPVVFPSDFGESATLLVAPNPTGFEVGDVVVSGQAGGIMHKVDSIIPHGPYAFVIASAANLEDVIPYMSFRGSVDAVPIEDEATVEHIPDESLLFSALNEDLQGYGTFHTVEEDIDVYKCTGEKYISSLGKEWTSTFFVMKRSDFDAFSVSEEDVIVGNNSMGWLETITDISSSGPFSYVETKLVNCAEMLPDGNRLMLASSSESVSKTPDLHCEGGDNKAGLMVYNGQTTEDLQFQIGDTVAGRNSGPFMSKVMSWTEVGEYVFIEASPVSGLNDTSTMNSTRLVRRRRDLFLGFNYLLNEETTISISGEAEGPGGVTFSGEASFSVEPYVKLRVGLELDLDWGWSFPPVHQAEARFVGEAGLGLKASGKISGSVKKSWTKKLAEGRIPPRICLPLVWFLCIPARLRYVVNLTLEVSASISAELKAEARADAGVTLGATWRRGNGMTPIFNSRMVFTASRSADAKVTGKAEAKLSLTPTLIFDLPAAGIPLNLPWWLLRRLPDWLRGESTGESALTLFSPKLALPVIALVAAEFCPKLDYIEWKAGIEEAVASVKIGIKDFSVDLSVKRKLRWVIDGKIPFPYCNSTTTPPPTTTTGGYGTSMIPYGSSPGYITTTPYDITTTPYDTTTTPYDTTTTPYDTTTTPYDTTTTPYDTTTTPYDNTTPYDTIRDDTTSFGTTPSPDIPCIVDLVFLLDGSCGIGRGRFEEAKQYIRDVVNCINMTDAQVGVIQFICASKWEIPFGKYADKMQLEDAIMNDVNFECGDRPRVGSAIYHMTCTTPFRDMARKVAVLLTDGRFGGRYAGRAQEARDAGIELYGTAVGRKAFIQMSGLNAITGNPARVVHWKQVDPCVFAATLCNSG